MLLSVGFLVSLTTKATLPQRDFNTPWVCDSRPDSLSHVWFRRMYLTDGRPRQATLTVTTTGRVKVYVNACNVGTAPYYPLRDDNDSRPTSISFDITPYLNADTNIVALLYSPSKPMAEQRQIAVTFYGTARNRQSFSYASNTDWLCRKANSGLTADGDEWIDGRHHNPDWNTTDYAAALWLPVKTPSIPLSPSIPSTPSTPSITHIETLRDPSTHGGSLMLPLGVGFYGAVAATLREARRGERIRLGRLIYICSGEIDEQAWPLFSAAYWGNAYVEGGSRFNASQVTTLQALSIGSTLLTPSSPFTPFTP